jgi:hypothetical protein
MSVFLVFFHVYNLLAIMRKGRYNCRVMVYNREVLIEPKTSLAQDGRPVQSR